MILYDFIWFYMILYDFMGNELIWIGDITITKIHDILCVCVFLGTLFEHIAILMVNMTKLSDFFGLGVSKALWPSPIPAGPMASNIFVKCYMQDRGSYWLNMCNICVTSRIFGTYPVMFQMLRKLPMASMCLRNSYWLMLLGLLSQLRFFIVTVLQSWPRGLELKHVFCFG